MPRTDERIRRVNGDDAWSRDVGSLSPSMEDCDKMSESFLSKGSRINGVRGDEVLGCRNLGGKAMAKLPTIPIVGSKKHRDHPKGASRC